MTGLQGCSPCVSRPVGCTLPALQELGQGLEGPPAEGTIQRSSSRQACSSSALQPVQTSHLKLMVEVTLPIFKQHRDRILHLTETVSLPFLTVHTVLCKSNFRSIDILSVFTVVHKNIKSYIIQRIWIHVFNENTLNVFKYLIQKNAQAPTTCLGTC